MNLHFPSPSGIVLRSREIELQLIDAVAGFYVPALKKINGGGYAVYRLRRLLEETGYGGIDQKLQQVLDQYAVSTPSQNDLDSWGYRLLAKQQTKSAIVVLDFAARLYPDNANAHDSLAEAYAANKETEPAIRHYRRSLELNPRNRNATDRLEDLGAIGQMK